MVIIPSYLKKIMGVAKGLKAIHETNIIHRDIKSVESINFCYERIIRLIHLQSNILISDDKKALISDFGLSRLVEATTGYSINSSDTCGSARWMSPEQLPHTSEQPIKLDSRNDVWSFGMVVYVRFRANARFQTTNKCSGLNRNVFQGTFLTANSKKF